MPKPKSPSLNRQNRLPKSEKQRLLALVELEKKVEARGFRRIAGVDEAGRGPLAGPVVAAACSLRCFHLFEGINDSKLLTANRRKALFEELKHHPLVRYGLGVVEAPEIDEVNILQATLLAMRKAVLALPEKPDYLLVDGNVALSVDRIPSEHVVKGDQRSQLIAAASILAKETRDELMGVYDALYPEYGFKEHKGYGTAKHRKALELYGPCPIHRKTFEPVRRYV